MEMKKMTIVGDEDAAQAVMDIIQERIDNMTEEDWKQAIDNLRKKNQADEKVSDKFNRKKTPWQNYSLKTKRRWK